MPLEISNLVSLADIAPEKRSEHASEVCLVTHWVPETWVIFDYHPTRHFASLYNPQHRLYREIPKSRLEQVLLTGERYDWEDGECSDIDSLPHDLDWDWEEIDRERKRLWGNL